MKKLVLLSGSETMLVLKLLPVISFFLLALSYAAMSQTSNSPVCYGTPVQLSCTGQGGCGASDAQYTWTDPNSVVIGTTAGVTIQPVNPSYISGQFWCAIYYNNNQNYSHVSTLVTLYDPIIISGTIYNIQCSGNNNGVITTTVSGGTTPYTYLWSPSGGTAATASNLAAGSYTVRVTGANGCYVDVPVTISQPLAALSATTTRNNISCFGGSTGSATVTASGGTAPYTYSWNTVPVQTTITATGLIAGTYTVTVTDAKGCQTTATANITAPSSAITFTATPTQILCYGGTGSVTLSASGGNQLGQLRQPALLVNKIAAEQE